MRRISIGELEQGMKLAKPVLNENGMVLLGEDTELTDAMIIRLRHMDITGVDVSGGSRPEKPLEEMLMDLNRRFEKVGRKPYMSMLKRIMEEHIKSLYE